MKLKKIASVLLATVIASVSFVLPLSAAAETITFTKAVETCYAIRVTASLAGAVTFKSGDRISISCYSGSTVPVSSASTTTTYYGTASETTFMGSELTQSLVTCELFGGANKFIPSTISSFTWTGLITLNDKSMHPVNDLGLNMSALNIPINMTITAASIGTVPQTLPITSATVVTVDDNTVMTSGSVINVNSFLNNGLGMTNIQKTRIKTGSDFRVTVNLSETLTTTTLFSFRTDLQSNLITTSGVKGDKKVVFENVPLKYFFDSETSSLFGIDYFFNNMYISGGNYYTSAVLTFTYGTSTSTSTTTAMPNASGVYDEEEEGSDAYINYPAITLNPGTSAYLVTDIDPAGLKRTTTSRSICRVFTSGRILAVAPGTATIAITNSKGEKVNCIVTVKNSSRPATSYKLNSTSGVVYKGQAYSLAKHTKSPSNTTDTITWSTSDPSIAIVNQAGRVTVVGTGTVQITAFASGGVSSTSKLTARNPFVSVSSGTTRSIKVGATHSIKTKVGPSSSTVTYSSSNSSVAKVSASGVVTGVKKGTATITIRSNRGASATVKITVT